MSNYIEYKDKITFHPGYYIKELVDESGLTQEDFAKRLGTTPKNLSILLKGEQSLSTDMALKLSRMMGTSVSMWLNLQQAYDEKLAEIQSDKELEKEREVFKYIDYTYFRKNYNLPDLPRQVDQQIKCVREFLSVASLSVLKEDDFAVSFRSASNKLSGSDTVNANAMIQIAMNQTIKKDIPKYNKRKFEKAVEYALTQTKNHDSFYPIIRSAFEEAGVALIVLPGLKNFGINGATKKVDGKIMLMVNERSHYADAFWFTLFCGIGQIMNGDMGLSTPDEKRNPSVQFALDALVPEDKYKCFVKMRSFDESSIRKFADSIDRDPGIVLGRLIKDNKIPESDIYLSKKLRQPYSAVLENYGFSKN